MAFAAVSPLTVAGAAPALHRTSLSHRKADASTALHPSSRDLRSLRALRAGYDQVAASAAKSNEQEGRMKIEGGCLCGKVRYSTEAEPAFVGVCHCQNC